MEQTIPRAMSMLTSTAEGQPARLEEIGLGDGFCYEVPEKLDPEKTLKKDLQEEITDLIFVGEAANRLHLNKFIEVARKAITHMAHSFVCCCDERPKT